MKSKRNFTSFRIVLCLLMAAVVKISIANNIQISQVRITDQNTTDHYTMVEFDLSWENSWRTSEYESNWDAAWIFIKYKKVDGAVTSVWNHCNLNYVDGTGAADGHTVPAGSVVKTTSDGVGVFVHRNANGIGNVSWSDIQLRWNYGDNGLADNDSVEIAVFGIEMVYVPQGSYYLGDGSASTVANFVAGTTTNPFQVTSENAITLGGGNGESALGNSNRASQHASYLDDWTNASTIALPAAFPKGYGGFYIMKYEISQDQYVEFLNTLTRTQQADRFPSMVVGNYFCATATSVPQNRNSIRLISDDDPTYPRVFGCDLDRDNLPNETIDGQSIACNWLSIQDALAYADWAGLRPITELEFEKACRGTITPLPNEYPWRTTTYANATSITNGGELGEVPGNTDATVCVGNHASVQGPLRVGSFARATSTKVTAGATYYGILNMTDNVRELVISVGHANGRSFVGGNGNGILDANGRANVADWPAGGSGFGWRGASWINTTNEFENFYGAVSKRYLSNLTTIANTTRSNSNGFRGGRTAE